jgi:transcriptional regulator with XRE-family HTH domain
VAPLSALVARNVRAERARRGWKQEQLADRLGWSRATVGNLESGVRRVQVDDLIPLCQAFEVPLIKLCEGLTDQELQALGLA